jgi:hypothetical protein
MRIRNSEVEVRNWILSLLLALVPGCATCPFLAEVSTPSYQPSNVYRQQPTLPSAVKRVAVMPLTIPSSEFGIRHSELEFGREMLWPVLVDELGRARHFELVPVAPESLRALTGRSDWSGEESLPLDFFDRLKESLGADAVLFCRLTQYRAYEPLTIGWRLKLVYQGEKQEVRGEKAKESLPFTSSLSPLTLLEPHILWAVDEVFDARTPEVAVAAKRYAAEHPESAPSLHDSRSVLLSPRRFGQYTTSAVVETLPRR